jgi:hypothetical protein
MDKAMAPNALYDASVPVFLRYLGRLDRLVTAAELAANAPALLGARLAPDMLSFELQVIVASNFALRASFPLTGKAPPLDSEFAHSFQGLHQRLTHVVQLLTSLQRKEFEGAEQRLVEDGAGKAVVTLKGAEFLQQYALPNFFFHLTTAYAILRHQGVAIGKEDFDGWHAY